jgi:Na+-driven multidrug efflux pump
MAGDALSLMAANGDTALAGMGYTYISILILCSPLIFMLSISIAALRSEGLLTAMAAITLMSALLNIAFDYLFIVELGAGVAGSAWGTVISQLCAISAVLIYRARSDRKVEPRPKLIDSGWSHWGELLALGAPIKSWVISDCRSQPA